MSSRLGSGNLTVTSAYRPASYQTHLREVWDTWMAIRNRTAPECEGLRAEALIEFTRHQLLESQRPAATSSHSDGRAFDANWRNIPTGETIDTIAASCGMVRPWPVRDRVHFQPR